MQHDANGTGDLVAALDRVVEGEVRFDAYSRMLYSTDASLYQVQPVGVVVPRTVDDVQATVEVAAKHGVPVLPRGGGSSLAGQCVGAAIVLDFSKYMTGVLDIDAEARTARTQPGTNFAMLNAAAGRHGLMLGPDPASAQRATVGGSVGNNATGAHSILYGMMADNVASTGVILADGSLARFGPLDLDGVRAKAASDSLEGQIYRRVPDVIQRVMPEILERWPKHWRRASGYNLDRLAAALLPADERGRLSFDSRFRPEISNPARIDRFNLAQLMTGSEGTLAVLTDVTLNLVPKPKQTGVAVIHFTSTIEACAAIPDILETEPSAAELLDKQVMDLARSQPEWAKKLTFIEGDPKAVMLTEFYGADEREVTQKIERLEDHLQKRGWRGTVIRVLDKTGQGNIWSVRKAGLNLLMSRRGDYKPVPGIEDVSVPQEDLASYLEEILDFCAQQPDIPDVAVYAHASAGCLHVRPLINTKTQLGVDILESVGTYAAGLAVKYRGIMSGEHGDGYMRSVHNPLIFGETLYGALQDVKRIFDPHNLMNPGKVVDAPPLTENLRYGPHYSTIELETVFDWSNDFGLAGAIEMCNGAGVCRKLNAGTMCPSYMATKDERDTTRGRANALRNALAGRIPHEELYSPEMYDVMDLCLGCKACKSECPSSVDMAKIKAEYLVHYYAENGLPIFNRLMSLLPDLNALLYRSARLSGLPLPQLTNWAMRTPVAKRLLSAIGVHPGRALPRYAEETFAEWFGSRESIDGRRPMVVDRQQSRGLHEYAVEPLEGAQEKIAEETAKVAPELPADQATSAESRTENRKQKTENGKRTVVLFHDTWTNYNEPHVGRAVVKVLEAAGYRVVLADGRKCCGRPAITGGQAQRAKPWVDHNVALLAPHAQAGVPIIGIEPSCILTLRDEYPTLASDKRRAKLLAEHALTFEEFVVRELDAGRFNAPWKFSADSTEHESNQQTDSTEHESQKRRVLLHGHCHHKALVGNESTIVALKAAGYQVEVVDSGCCGMAGDFGYTTNHYEVSYRVGEDRLFPAVRDADASTTVVASGTSCRHQIGDFTPREAVHLAEALAAAVA